MDARLYNSIFHDVVMQGDLKDMSPQEIILFYYFSFQLGDVWCTELTADFSLVFYGDLFVSIACIMLQLRC